MGGTTIRCNTFCGPASSSSYPSMVFDGAFTRLDQLSMPFRVAPTTRRLSPYIHTVVSTSSMYQQDLCKAFTFTPQRRAQCRNDKRKTRKTENSGQGHFGSA
eukprot:8782435-Prorocentrum_lima.AAC.1